VAVAIVTGASRGIGRGVAIALAHAGYTIHATGRSILRADLPSSVSRHRCDHLRDEDTAAVFASAGDAGGGVGKQD
jgi:dehydrogenase/reductase SDR family protein 1